jgi:hypothetical protein
VSLRSLYRQIPSAKRTCNYYACQDPILRNIDRDKKGRLYHHGCLLSAQDEAYRCLECYAIFDGTEVSFEFEEHYKADEVSQRVILSCPHCGCRALKRLRRAISC